MSGPTATVVAGSGELEVGIPPRIAGGPIVAGDLVELGGDHDSPRVRALRPRRTLLARGDFGTRNRSRPWSPMQTLLLVVAAMVDPPFRMRFVDRYLAAGELGGLDSAVLLTRRTCRTTSRRSPARSRSTGRSGTRSWRDRHRSRLRGSGAAAHRRPRRRACGPLGRREVVPDRCAHWHAADHWRSLTGGPGRHTTSDPRLIFLPGGGAVVRHRRGEGLLPAADVCDRVGRCVSGDRRRGPELSIPRVPAPRRGGLRRRRRGEPRAARQLPQAPGNRLIFRGTLP